MNITEKGPYEGLIIHYSITNSTVVICFSVGMAGMVIRREADTY